MAAIGKNWADGVWSTTVGTSAAIDTAEELFNVMRMSMTVGWPLLPYTMSDGSNDIPDMHNLLGLFNSDDADVETGPVWATTVWAQGAAAADVAGAPKTYWHTLPNGLRIRGTREEIEEAIARYERVQEQIDDVAPVEKKSKQKRLPDEPFDPVEVEGQETPELTPADDSAERLAAAEARVAEEIRRQRARQAEIDASDEKFLEDVIAEMEETRNLAISLVSDVLEATTSLTGLIETHEGRIDEHEARLAEEEYYDNLETDADQAHKESHRATNEAILQLADALKLVLEPKQVIYDGDKVVGVKRGGD